jgi:hypothetical protein
MTWTDFISGVNTMNNTAIGFADARPILREVICSLENKFGIDAASPEHLKLLDLHELFRREEQRTRIPITSWVCQTAPKRLITFPSAKNATD